jgi:hypothetical protein
LKWQKTTLKIRNMSKRKHKDWNGETTKLSEFLDSIGILEEQVVQFNEYHIRVLGKETIDIWAGTKKFLVLGSTHSNSYKNLNELKEYLV